MKHLVLLNILHNKPVKYVEITQGYPTLAILRLVHFNSQKSPSNMAS